MNKSVNLNLTIERMKILLSLVENYPRNMRQPFETNGEFQDHLKSVDSIKNDIESAIIHAEMEI